MRDTVCCDYIVNVGHDAELKALVTQLVEWWSYEPQVASSKLAGSMLFCLFIFWPDGPAKNAQRRERLRNDKKKAGSNSGKRWDGGRSGCTQTTKMHERLRDAAASSSSCCARLHLMTAGHTEEREGYGGTAGEAAMGRRGAGGRMAGTAIVRTSVPAAASCAGSSVSSIKQAALN